MKFINQYHEIMSPISPKAKDELKLIENVARTCYKSENKITNDSYKNMVKSLINRNHTAMLEHSMLTVKFVTNRAIANEIVRHRHTAYAQESTRWCNYTIEDKFDDGINFVIPHAFKNNKEATEADQIWVNHMEMAERDYKDLISKGWKPEDARGVLPLDLKTELVMTTNYREWLSVLELRTASDAHPMVRELMINLTDELKERIPIVFDNVWNKLNCTDEFDKDKEVVII